MPGVAVLTHIDVMVGVDFHDEVAPPGSPVPSVPHAVTGLLCSAAWGATTGKANLTVWSTGGMVLSRGSDMGFLIPHVPLGPAGALASLLTATSGSKSGFGAHRHRGPQGPLAAACLGATGLNLNCGGDTQPPALSGMVLAFFQLTRQGFAWGDVIAGALHAAVDTYLQHRLNASFDHGWGAGAVSDLKSRVTGALGWRAAWIAARLPARANVAAQLARQLVRGTVAGARDNRFIQELPTFVASSIVGTPIGYSLEVAPISRMEVAADQADDAVQRSIDRMFEDPAVEEHPAPEVPCAP